MALQQKLQKFFIVSSSDPDDARRRQLLNIFLAVVGLIALIAIIADLIIWKEQRPQEALTILMGSIVTLFGLGGLYWLNMRKSGTLAASLFVLFLLVVFSFSDSPQQIVDGRSLWIFVVPIIITSGLLKSWSSFVVAAISSGIVIALASVNNLFPNLVALFLYFIIAFVSWTIASNLEQALNDVRRVNANLDRLVQERTQALVSALSRERIEASRSRAILDSIADGVIVFDLRGRATHTNPALVRLLEIPEGELSAMNIDDLTRVPALDAKNRGILAGLLTSSGQQISSYRIQWGKKTLSVSSAQVTDNTGERLGIVAVFRDYTREAEVERMKSTFLAIVSHELRTPLNAILGYAEMLKEAIYGPVNEKQVRASDRILSNVRRLLDLVNDLLDQAQIEAGKMTVQMQPFRPADLLDNVHGVMNKIAADKNISLTSELDPTLPETINGDPARLQQILVNLTNNAIKFTDKGTVHIRLFRPDKHQWSLEVIDTGIGIPEDELPHIFEAFRQADSTTTRRHGGFGLGLAIVQQLTNLMGGSITVKSQVGVGSIFTVTLPLVAARKTRGGKHE